MSYHFDAGKQGSNNQPKKLKVHTIGLVAIFLIWVIIFASPGSLLALFVPDEDVENVVARLETLPLGTAGMIAEYIPETGMVYLIGGYRTEGSQKELSKNVWRYDPLLDSLEQLTDLSYGVALGGSTYVPDEGLIYIFSGLDDSQGSIQQRATVHAYDLNTGVISTAVAHNATNPSGTRNSAVYVREQNKIYVFYGPKSETTMEGQRVVRALNLDNGQLEAMPNTPLLSEDNYWGAAHLVPLTYPYFEDTEKPDDTDIYANRFIMVLGSEGYAIFNPNTERFVDFGESTDLYYPRGAATAYLPGKQKIWLSGGKRGDCFRTGSVLKLNPKIPTPSGEFASDLVGFNPLPNNTQNDGSAVYVTNLDRVLFFGGFHAPTPTCGTPWPEAPNPSSYQTGIFAAAPEYGVYEKESGLVISSILNPTIGENKMITIEKVMAPSDVTEEYLIAIQAAFLDENNVAQPGFETVYTGSIQLKGDHTTQSIAIDIPENIAPSPTNDDGRQVIAFCILSIDTFQKIPNCREHPVTLNPGGLKGTIREDLAGLGQTGTPPLEGAVLELIDVDGDLVDTSVTGPDGQFDFCPGGRCLAVGSYTLNVRKPYESSANPEDRYMHVPIAREVDIMAGSTLSIEVNLETKDDLGPQINRMTAQHNALFGDYIGSFLSFEHLRGQPDVPDIPVVNNRFYIEVTPTIPIAPDPRFEISSVVVNLNGHERTATETAYGLYEVDFDMSAVLSAGINNFTITSYDSQSPPSTNTRTYYVEARPAKPRTNGQGSLPEFYVNLAELGWNPITETYTSKIIVPAGLRNPGLKYPNPGDSDYDPGTGKQKQDVKFNGKEIRFFSWFRADVEILEEFHIGGKESAVGSGAFEIQVVSTEKDENLVDEKFKVTPIMNGFGDQIESYLVETPSYDLCKYLHVARCGSWQLLGGYGPTYKAKGFELNTILSFYFQYGLSVGFDGTLRGDNYTLKKVRIIPQPTVALQARGGPKASIGGGIIPGFDGITIGAQVTTTGRLIYHQPIAIEPPRPDPFLESPCFNFVIKGGAWFSIPTLGGFLKADEEIDILDEKLGECKESAYYAPLSLPEPPAEQPSPVVVMAPDRGHTLRLWTEQELINGEGVFKLHYQIESATAAGEGTVPGVIAPAQPAAAFTGSDSAFVVWSQFDPAKFDLETSSLVEILSTQEIYAAAWTESGGWAAPVRLTNNNAADGLPVIAADPNSGEALVAWSRDFDADPRTKGDLTIMARHWNGSSWEAEGAIGTDPNKADTQPLLAYHPDGGEAWMIWARDHDRDFTTNADRRLNYAIWNGTAWSTPVEPGSWPAGAIYPAMVFSPESDKPLVTMIVRGALGENWKGDDLGEEGAGVGGRLYAAWYGSAASGWDLQNIYDTRVGSAYPVLASPNRALIVMRNFGGGPEDGYPSGGRIAVAAGEINPDGARWVEPGLVTANADPVWQIKGYTVPLNDPSDVDFGLNFVAVKQDLGLETSMIRSVLPGTEADVAPMKHVTAKNLAGDDETTVFDVGMTTEGVDIELEEVEFSNLNPVQGEIVTIKAKVRSLTVRPLTWTNGTSTRLEIRGLRGGYNENIQLFSELYAKDMLFNETHTFTAQYRSTGEAGRILVRVRYPGDLDTSNNEVFQRVGIMGPPQELRVDELALTRDLSWNPPEESTPDMKWLYRVYRGPSPDGPWDLLGLSRERFYVDDKPSKDDAYYAIEAYDQFGHRSEKASGTHSERPDLPITTGEAQLSFTKDEVLVQENGGNAIVNINLDKEQATDVTVKVESSNGSATAGSDYKSISQNMTFSPGETEKKVEIPIINDNKNEGNEAFIVTLSNPQEAVLSTKDMVTVTILDDDDAEPDPPAVSFNQVTWQVTEGVGGIEVPVVLSKQWYKPVSVKVKTAPGTADSGADFEPQSKTITFNAGEALQHLSIPIVNDNIFEANESFTVTLSDADGASLGSMTKLTITLLNDDDPPPPNAPIVNLGNSKTTVNENVGEVSVAVNLSKEWTETVRVFISSTNGTAVSGSDYTAVGQTITFDPGQTEKTIQVPILNDNVKEGTEVFTINLSDPEGATLGNNQQTVTIKDDDQGGQGSGLAIYLPAIMGKS